MPKCASTWLQRHFFNPPHGFREGLSPLDTFLAFVSPPSFQWAPCRSLVDLNASDGLVPVISSEALVGNPLTGGHDGEANLHRLHSTFPEARILIIIREQDAMLRSLYKLLLNFGYPYKIGTVLYNDLTGNVPTFGLKYLSYHHTIEAYQQTFGEASVLVLPYELFKSKPEEFLDAIRAFCHIDTRQYPLQAQTSKRENTNRTLVSLEIKRLHNRYLARTKFSMGGVYTPIEIKGKGNIRPRLPAFVDRWMERRFANKVRIMTRGFYADSNAKTESLTGLQLAEHGYQLPKTGRLTSSGIHT